MNEVILFNIENQRLALDVHQVERVIWAVAVTEMPKSPKYLLGIINMEDKVIPVINMRRLLRLPKRQMKLSDQLLLCRIGCRTIAMWIDNVQGMYTYSNEEKEPGSEVSPETPLLDYVIKQDEEIAYVYKWEELIPVQDLPQSTGAAS